MESGVCRSHSLHTHTHTHVRTLLLRFFHSFDIPSVYYCYLYFFRSQLRSCRNPIFSVAQLLWFLCFSCRWGQSEWWKRFSGYEAGRRQLLYCEDSRGRIRGVRDAGKITFSLDLWWKGVLASMFFAILPVVYVLLQQAKTMAPILMTLIYFFVFSQNIQTLGATVLRQGTIA